VLDLYAEPHDPRRPVIGFDERPFQKLGEVREPLPVEPGKPKRVDSEYEREGRCCLFLAVEPKRGWRHLEVRERRTAKDFAEWMKELVDRHFPEAEKIRVVLDNLNTHTPASFYKAFPAEEARRLTQKLEFHYTPVHGSWLNVAEIEYSVLERQCLNRRIPTNGELQREVGAWEEERNRRGVKIEWQFTTAKAREKFRRFYPKA